MGQSPEAAKNAPYPLNTLAELLKPLGMINRVSTDSFLQSAGIRLFILKNEGRLLPRNIPEIQRAKLWNLHGTLWLEIENWGIETRRINTCILKIGPAGEIKDKPLDYKIKRELLWELDGTPKNNGKATILEKLIQSEISTRIVSTLEAIGTPGAPPPHRNMGCCKTHEPLVFFDFANVLKTVIKFGECLNRENTLINVIEEEKEGSLASMQYLLRQTPANRNEYQLLRKTSEPLLDTEATQSFETLSSEKTQPCLIPLDTLLTLIEEQMTWANWLARSRPTPIDALEMSRYIHKSGDFQRIFSYLRKKQNQQWEVTAGAACKQNLLALLLSAATAPMLNEKLSAKIDRLQINHSIHWVINKGGLLNQALIKNAWAFGIIKPFASPETLERTFQPATPRTRKDTGRKTETGEEPAGPPKSSS